MARAKPTRQKTGQTFWQLDVKENLIVCVD
jgi:hypothetical protein